MPAASSTTALHNLTECEHGQGGVLKSVGTHSVRGTEAALPRFNFLQDASSFCKTV